MMIADKIGDCFLPNRVEKERLFQKHVSTNIPGIAATKVALRRVLACADFIGWSRREESGRLDRRALTRYAVGDASIFSRRAYKDSTASVVQILIDISASTELSAEKGGTVSRVQIFSEVAAHLAKLLDECKVTLGITGFYGGRYQLTPTDVEESVTFTEIKGYKESLRSAQASIAAIPHVVDGSTPDYSALSETIQSLSRRPEQRKILFILTDVDDYQVKHIQHLNEVAKKLGIVIIGIGVGKADITKCFTHSANVKSVAEVFTQSFNKLLNSLKG
jgi:cobalamin biosynthesis protein CobT